MIEIIDRYFTHSDDRGTIEGLVNFGTWEEVNVITSEPGVERGGHYHKETVELFFILDGEIEVTLQNTDEGRPVGESQSTTVSQGAVFMIPPGAIHLFKPLKQSRWINILSKKIDPKNPDIHQPQS